MLIFLISTPWLNSPNCHHEFNMLLKALRGDGEGRGVFFWIMDKGVKRHPNWVVLANKIGITVKELEATRDVVHDFTNKDQQNDAMQKCMHKITETISFWPKGASKPRKLTERELVANYARGAEHCIPGFERQG